MENTDDFIVGVHDPTDPDHLEWLANPGTPIQIPEEHIEQAAQQEADQKRKGRKS